MQLKTSRDGPSVFVLDQLWLFHSFESYDHPQDNLHQTDYNYEPMQISNLFILELLQVNAIFLGLLANTALNLFEIVMFEYMNCGQRRIHNTSLKGIRFLKLVLVFYAKHPDFIFLVLLDNVYFIFFDVLRAARLGIINFAPFETRTPKDSLFPFDFIDQFFVGFFVLQNCCLPLLLRLNPFRFQQLFIFFFVFNAHDLVVLMLLGLLLLQKSIRCAICKMI